MHQSSHSARKFSIRFTVGTMFIFATVITAMIAISLQYYFSRQMSQEHVLTKLTMASSEISEYIQQIEVNATSSAQILRSVSSSADRQFSARETRDIFLQVLKDNPMFYSLYYGNEREDFYQIINLESSPIVREKLNAEERDRWVLINIRGDDSNRIRTTEYLTKQLTRTRIESESSNYFPSQRPWYHGAKTDSVYKTDPYLFKHLKITGQTYSTRSKTSVIGVDIVLSSVSSKISADAMGIKDAQGIEAFLFNQHGEVIASNLPERTQISIPAAKPMALTQQQAELVRATPTLVVSNQNNWGPYDFARAGEPQGYAIDTLKLLSKMTGIQFEFVNGFDSQALVDKFNQGKIDVIHSVTNKLNVESSVAGMTLYSAPLGIAALATQPVLDNFAQLKQQPLVVVKGRGVEEVIRSIQPNANIQAVASFDAAQDKLLNGQATYVIDSYLALNEMKGIANTETIVIEPLGDLGRVPFQLLLSKQNSGLLPILSEALEKVTEQQNQALQLKWLDENVSKGGFVPYRQLYELALDKQNHSQMILADGDQNYLYVTQISAEDNSGQEYFAVVVPKNIITAQVFDRLITSMGITALAMIIILPIAWVCGSPIVKPITQLRAETTLIKQRKFSQVQLVDSHIKEVHELSESMVEMVKEIEKYHKEREAFIDAFICLIAQAIDDKSPYTAGHCNRVPELGIMLANIAEQSTTGKFKGFKFNNDDERREFRIAAWLHDCGKITTPEHIVDKGTKLEANYNRIHEIRTRFEVLWRDAEIEYLKAVLEQKQSKSEAFEQMHQRHSQLQQDFEFVANANVGGEFMSDDKVARVRQIAQQKWLRHFDNRLGLSPFEELSKMPVEETLPTEESLLSDKPEHIIHRVNPFELDPTLGLNIEVPEHQYNQGELYNLTISRGTLTAEDRFKINEHMISGIKMLEALPFPPELAKVPRYASTHHETLDGKGYPRKLDGSELSVPERILAIADIFEALTAADRPYKKAKPLSIAIDIMHSMALNKHIDYDLFMLFLTSGGFEQYAEAFLPPQQIDKVDLSKYIKDSQPA
ncbi:transporter substrate-binding domain-containing protein [Vibrio sp. 404]|uniref:Transporter substrate-binding domain-containing protein n=1 Tax=Vibrio marinisediminis TaxID=2758441 RepID=A0A7W2FRS2_9VIBR|nr:HD domain-containing phosphohydrolase [Vibrio marinisediminis]MBA5762949.1 transporter substrate-binding domain-containing protein [Vibrio marinisediminis]